MSDNGDGDKKLPLPTGMDENSALKLVKQYSEMANENLEPATQQMLGLFMATYAKYISDTFALDPMRLRFMRVVSFGMAICLASYALGATKGLSPQKKEGDNGEAL